MSRQVRSSRDAVLPIFTDRSHPPYGLPCGLLRLRNEAFLSSQVGEIIDDAEKFSVSIDTQNFAPNEITACLFKIICGKFCILMG
uniref:Uncharacterized protein n=1 Tax=Setaria digitata TaxID=48799 RepID=A0A915Q6T7_9BILA